ncbi:hypothetical protein [Stenotrophomonas sp. 22385]|uniref:hypothetical protein n=1 Tax=Stenotrophomonas sp. 22385 TaxID=3453915 RepID=UPI003F86F000
MLIPIYSFAEPDIDLLMEALTEHGIVIADVMRTQAGPIGETLSRAILGASPPEDSPHVLHLSCPVEPQIEHGWVDFYMYSLVYDGTPGEATKLVEAAVRQWGEEGKPETFLASVGTLQMPEAGGWHFRFGRWELLWRERAIAIVVEQPNHTAFMTLNALKMLQVKHVTAANVDQAKRFAERWCAARLIRNQPIREAVAMIRGASRDEAGC